MTLLAIDLSNNNPEPTDFEAARSKSNIHILVHKATDGTAFADAFYGSRMRRAQHAGIHRMSYHYGELGDPIAEAAWASEGAPVMYGPYSTGVLDLEIEQPGDHSAWALSFLRTFWTRTSRKPWLYGSVSYIQEHYSDPALGDFPLWLAAWPTGATDADEAWLLAHAPAAPGPWASGPVSLWQYTNAGTVAGMPGRVDRSIFLGTESEFRKLH